jgi:SAM-dependent methyltransferase
MGPGDTNEAYDAATYGERIAGVYDDWYAELPYGGDLSAAVAFLTGLAGDGPALELGIGTGRVAIPLRGAGVEVHGIDASQAMVARLHDKPGGALIPVAVEDFRTFSLGRRFRLVYVVFNTFFGLLTQDDQLECFRAIAAHLEPGGAFAMEAFVPDLQRFDRGQRVSVVDVGTDEIRLETTMHDALAQRSTSQHVVLREDGIRLYPVRIRYAFVPELDLMARLAGLELRERWADWDRTPLSNGSVKHISVWGAPAER